MRLSGGGMIGRQVLVGVGMIVAGAIVWLAWVGPLHPLVNLPPEDAALRIAFAARWLFVPAATLFLGIAIVAGQRFFLSEAMDGTRAPANRSLEITLRYNQNTLEQTVLVAIAWPLLALYLPEGRLGLVPVLAVLFAFGRIAFFVGYLIAPWARAFGFGLTFYPTVAAYVWLLLRMLR